MKEMVMVVMRNNGDCGGQFENFFRSLIVRENVIYLYLYSLCIFPRWLFEVEFKV